MLQRFEPSYLSRLVSRRFIGSVLLISLLMCRADSSAADDAPADTAVSPSTTPNESVTKQKIEELIRQLGSPRYTERRAAANELRQIGAEAFDLLNAAMDNSDPEVAASAQYLLRQINVRWVQSEDSTAVRAILRDYGDQSDERRSGRVDRLATLADGEGVAALCRIARFDRSPLISRKAALAIIRPTEKTTDRPPIDPEMVAHELGASTRVAAVWLRHFIEQIRDPAASIAQWRQVVDEETARLEEKADDTSAEILLGLLWNLADLYRQLDDKQALAATVGHMVQLDADQLEKTVIELLAWLTEHESWESLDRFLADHSVRFTHLKRPLYYAALARAKQGKKELAEELAKQAAQVDSQTPSESFLAAKDLEEHKQFEWAVREYHRAVDKQPIASHEVMVARIYLASLLHDYEQHKQAADELEPLVKAVRGEAAVGQRYAELQKYYKTLPESESLAARLHYYRACQYREEKDWQRVRDELELAIRFDPDDADVLIAMYRLPDADEKWKRTTGAKIRDLTREFQQAIDEDPSDPTAYNQWAWLVSNTEGDFQKAIRYSHRSIELIPSGAEESAAASFLDTLGRCYYAAGDYKNAVKYQRDAVAKVDYMQVMQRQLSVFEKTLAEKGDGQSARPDEK
jgi:tetratricopeptide (TPR) repeat protein